MKHIICNKVDGFDEKVEEALALASGNPLLVMFTGAIVKESGQSWCPDCTAAHPVIMDVMKDTDAVMLEVPLTRTIYRDPTLIFRTRADIKLNCVPTLLRWGTMNKLDDSQSQQRGLVEMLLED
jgi:thiol-disulfide isomerase/thioredoxin